MKNKAYIGIDPGFKGGVCVLDDAGQIIDLRPLPVIKMGTKSQYDVPGLVEHFKNFVDRNNSSVYLEVVSARPGQGVVSMFRFGEGLGILKGVVQTLELPLFMVRPQEWKREMLKGTDKSKVAAIVKAKQICPTINLKRTDRSKKDDDGLAEAYLIARYGYETSRTL